MAYKTRWKDIFKALQSLGISVYSPGQHIGECLNSYTVVRDAGAQKLYGYSTVQQFYDILCYVPRDKFSELEVFVSEVEKAMKSLEPMIKPLYTKTQSFYDDTLKGHMVSIQYVNYCQIVN